MVANDFSAEALLQFSQDVDLACNDNRALPLRCRAGNLKRHIASTQSRHGTW